MTTGHVWIGAAATVVAALITAGAAIMIERHQTEAAEKRATLQASLDANRDRNGKSAPEPPAPPGRAPKDAVVEPAPAIPEPRTAPPAATPAPAPTQSAVDVKEIEEEPATADATVRGRIVVCKLGVAPSHQQYAGEGASPAELCIATDDGRVVKVKYQRYAFGPDPPPVYYKDQRLSIYNLDVGDYVECRMKEAAVDRDDGLLHTPSNVRAGDATLRDVQVLRTRQ